VSRLGAVLARYGWRTPVVVAAIASARLRRATGGLTRAWLLLSTQGTKGRRIAFGRGVTVTPGGHVDIGDKVHIGDRVHLEIGIEPRGRLRIGDSSWLSHDGHIQCRKSVEIGRNVLIGEFVSIRDSTHAYSDPDRPTKQQGDLIGTIQIQDDVWIGRGCLVQGRPEGIVIGQGAVVAANSVVSAPIPPMEVWGGVPARFIKRRGE
jgi:acetyltransferase-like isoleucine patch superfamily enzyme